MPHLRTRLKGQIWAKIAFPSLIQLRLGRGEPQAVGREEAERKPGDQNRPPGRVGMAARVLKVGQEFAK